MRWCRLYRHSSMQQTVVDRLRDLARTQPEQIAVIDSCTGKQCSYRLLDLASSRVANELTQAGIGMGDRTVLMVPPSITFFILVFALFKNGAIMVAVDPGLGVKRLGKSIIEAKPSAFIGNATAVMAKYLWRCKTITTTIVADQRYWAQYVFPTSRHTLPSLWRYSVEATQDDGGKMPVANDTAAILFTSGSTGAPKGAVYTHANFAAQIDILQTQYAIQAGEIDLGTFPLFALFASALGTTALIPTMNFTRPGHVNAKHILNLITLHRVTSMFASPALLDRLTRYADRHNITLPIQRRVVSAGAPVPTKLLRRCLRVLPETTEVYTAYGATEALPISTIRARDILAHHAQNTARGMGVCIGRPIAGVKVEIIPIRTTPHTSLAIAGTCGEGEIGEIIVQGKQVTASYYGKTKATAAAKISNGAGGYYHRMGDAGYLDGEGYLWFCGRVAERIVTASGSLFTAPCEGVFDAHPAVFRSALVGVITDQKHPTPVMCIELEPHYKFKRRRALTSDLKTLANQYPTTCTIRHILYHPALPVDIRHNAKINRRVLTRWAQKRFT